METKVFLRKNQILFYIAFSILIIKYYFLFEYLNFSSFESSDSSDYLSASKNLENTYLNFSGLVDPISLSRLPIYPIFLNVFSSKLLVISIQIFLQLIMGVICILIIRKTLKITNSFLNIVIFLLIQVESSLFVYSYRILSEILFSFILLLLIYMIILKTEKKNNVMLIIFVTILTILIMLIRPTAIALLFVFLSMSIFEKKRILFVSLSLLSILVYGSYSYLNYTKSGIFVYSTTQNSNLFEYEGVPAKAISRSVSKQEIQKEESELKHIALGENPTLKESNNYHRTRGLELILENKYSFLKLHIVGVFKVLYGPNKLELEQIFSDEGRLNLTKIQSTIILYSSIVMTFIISSLGIFGAFLYFRKNYIYRLMSLTILSFLILSSGGSAYGRFRTPISALLVIFASLVLIRLQNSIRIRYLNKI